MRAYELLENDERILKNLKWYYKVKQNRIGIGFNSYYRRLKENDIPMLSEKFLDPKIEGVIVELLKGYIITNANIAVDIISEFGEHRQELYIRIYDIVENRTISHDRDLPESDKLVFDSKEDADSFIMALKLELNGSDIDEYYFIIDDEVEE